MIILLDIFAIFYLVFVSFYRVTRLVRMIGWIWVGVLITADVIIVAIHPCIITLLCILFTIMIMTAILSVVLPSIDYQEVHEQIEDNQRPKKDAKVGSYVIREIDKNKYCFDIYDRQDKFLVRSYNCYKTVSDVKEAIRMARRNGEIADVEDRTANWIKEVNHPKYEMNKENDLYYFKLSIDTLSIMFKSDSFKTLQECKKQLEKTIKAVQSLAVYISVEKLSSDEAQQYKNMKPISFGTESPKAVEASNVQVFTETSAEEKKVDESAVVINTSEKKTLWESYNELSKEQKSFFDGLRKAAQEKVGSREFESSVQLSYVLFKDKLMRIQIRRNTVEAIFMLMDSTFKQLKNAGDIKIKETKTVIRLENEAYYSLALETLDKKYDLLLEQKAERENQRKKKKGSKDETALS